MRVILYSKPDCPLCDDVKRDLLEIQRAEPFTLEVRNILEAAQDFERFRYLIPVVDVEGGPTLFPPHDWSTLERAIRVARSARPEESALHGTRTG